MGIRGNRDLYAHVPRHLAARVVDIQPAGMSIEFQTATSLIRRLHHLLHVDRIGGPVVNQPPRGMPQNGEMRIVHGPDNPVGLFLARKVKGAVDRADRVIQPRKQVIGKVEAAVFEDIHLARFQKTDAIEFCVQRVDFVDLGSQLVGAQPACHGLAAGMIGDPEIVISLFPGCLSHFADCEFAVAGLGVAVQIAAHVIKRHRFRECAFLGGGDLAPVFAQHGGDERKAQLVIDLFLTLSGNPVLTIKKAIFVELPAFPDGPFSQGDVVRFRAGEIEHGRSIAHLGHHPQIDTEARLQDHGRPGGTLAGYLIYFTVSRKGLGDITAPLRRHQNVEIAHRFLASPETARNGGLFHAIHRFDVVHYRRGDMFSIDQA